MKATALSIDPSGSWSPRQAAKVLEVIGPEAEAAGLRIEQIDVSTFKASRVLLAVQCGRHGCHVWKDEACPRCVAEVQA